MNGIIRSSEPNDKILREKKRKREHDEGLHCSHLVHFEIESIEIKPRTMLD